MIARRGGVLLSAAVFTLAALAVLRLPTLIAFPWLVALSLPALLPWRGRQLWSVAVLAVLLTTLRAQGVLDQRWPAARTGEEVQVQGVVASLPQSSPATADGFDKRKPADGAAADDETSDEAPDKPVLSTQRFLFEPDAAGRQAGVPAHIRAAWYRTDQHLKAGECWRMTLRLRTPHGSRNPGGFDYEAWLFRQGIGATATVRDAQPCGTADSYRVLRARQALVDRFTDWLPQHPALPLVSAFAIGDTSGISDDDWQTFRLTGTTHLIAISGFNIAIVAGIAFFLLRWSWALSPRLCLRLPGQRAALIGSALLALGYAALAGFEAPVQRAAWMLVVFVMAAALGGLAQPKRALALAWLAIVAVDPLALMTPGLWLSFGAVAAIFLATSGRVARPAAWRAAIQLQLMLSLVLAPLALYFFQGTSLSGPLVNLIAVPIVALLTPTVLAALLAAWLLPSLGLPLLRHVADLLAWLQQGLGWIATHAPQGWIAASPPLPALLLAGIGGLLLFAPRGVPLRLLGLLCWLPLFFPVQTAPKQGFSVTTLDVGQGLAVVVRTAHHDLLFDTGPATPDGFDAGRAVVVPYLLHEGIRRLDRLMISHSDLDHRGGAPAVRELIQVDDEIGAMVPDKPCVEGDQWDWDGVHFRILNGPAPGRSTNDGGCVLKIETEGFSALLPADIERGVEARLVADYGAQLHVDLLLTPHHGSRTSSSPAFVAAVAPKFVVHSAGWHHRFHHPRPEVVERYRLEGAAQFNTATAGAVSVEPVDGTLRVRTERSESPRLWSTNDD